MTNVPKTEPLTSAHREALELLTLVHRICVANGITYTLAGEALLCAATGADFCNAAPRIDIALLYNDYQKLLEMLAKESGSRSGLQIINAENTRQFDSVVTWLVKKSRVRLPSARHDDEIYYSTKLAIIPVFHAGNSLREWKNMAREYKKAAGIVDSRAPLPQRSIKTRIWFAKKLIRNAMLLKLRDRRPPSPLLSVLTVYNAPTEYAFFPSTRKTGACNIKTNDYANVQTISFAGVDSFIPKNVDYFIENMYSQGAAENFSSKNRSQLQSKGGETLRRVQLVQTEMLIEFDRICRKNNLKYNIAFGTLLGAVRHGGFIPWDDDIDILMPYEEYIKLDQAMEKDLDKGRFFFRTHETENDFNLTYKHLKRNGTVYMKPGREKFNFHKGILIDIFPVFNSAGNRLAHWIHTRLAWFFRTATWAHMGADGEQNPALRFYYRQLAKIGNKRNYRYFLRVAAMFKKNKGFYSYFAAFFRSPYHAPYLTPECFDNPVEVEFEGHRFFAPKNYDAALSYCFGRDYMMYPPLRKRIPQHYAVIDAGDLFSFTENQERGW